MRRPATGSIVGTLLVACGLVLGGVAATYAFTPVSTIDGIGCGTILQPVYPAARIDECLNAGAVPRIPALILGGLGLALLIAGTAAAWFALQAERAAVHIDS